MGVVNNIKYASPDKSKISLNIDADWLGGENIPMIVSADYDTEFGRNLFARVISGEFGTISEYIAPEPGPIIIPGSVSMRQARLVLLQEGLLDDVETSISSLSGTEGKAAQIEWEYATTVERNSPLISQVKTLLSLTEEQLDQLFLTAKQL